MAKVVSDIAVTVGADITPLSRAMRKGSTEVKSFGDNFTTQSRKIAKGAAIIAAGATVAAGGIYTIVKNAAEAGAEIENLSRIAGATPENFQKMAAAAETVGIEQSKLADILKDTQDKVGDFLSTGGGPLKDFFENIAPQIGVTADQFRTLSGPQALQLYFDSLDKANLSASEMTFYLEALASDATALIPILADSGAEIERIGQAAQEAGRIMSDDAVNGSAELKRELDDLTTGIKTKFTQAILENKDDIIALADNITTVWIPALISVAEQITNVINLITQGFDAYNRFMDAASGNSISMNAPITESADQGRYDAEQGEFSNEERGIDSGNTGVFGVDESGNLIEYGTDSTQGNSGTDFLMGGDGSDSFGFAEATSSTEAREEELEALRNYFVERNEIVVGGLAEEETATRAHISSVQKVEALSNEQKIAAIRGALGDVATLMRSENKKLFAIGKAAAIADAIIRGKSAAVAAWDKGMKVGGPTTAALFTAASLAKTGALISDIVSQSAEGSSGGGSGGGGGGSTSSSSTSTDTSTTTATASPTEVTLLGPAMLTELLYLLSEEAGANGVTFVRQA